MALESIKVTVATPATSPVAVVVGIQGPAGPPGSTGPTGATGDTGASGAAGANGAAGAAGIDGADGTQIYSGSGAPSDGLGVDGDYYIDIATGGLYMHGGSTGWNFSFNLTGPAGAQGATGSTGAAGAAGAQGPAGSDGAAGADGTIIFGGTGAPADGLGVDGDYYIDTATGDLYQHGGSVGWNLSLNLRGPTGSQGATGATGSQGAAGNNGAAGSAGADGIDGARWFHDAGAPSDGLGQDGDYYLDTSSGDIYQHGGSVGWNPAGNIKGLTGATGAQGPQGDAGPQGPSVDAAANGVVVKNDIHTLDFSSDFNVTEESDGSVRVEHKKNLTVGYTATAYDNGTKSGGTFIPDPSLGNMQRAVNGGAHTLNPPSVGVGDALTMVIQYTNNASAGAITTSGFTKVGGDALTTVNGDDFLFYITVINGLSHLNVMAMQ